MILVGQLENEHYPALPHAASWIVLTTGEIVLLWQTVASVNTDPPQNRWSKWQIATLVVASFRILWAGLMSALWVLLYWLYKRQQKKARSASASESSSLLGEPSGGQNHEGYGTTPLKKTADKETSKKEDAPVDGWARRTTTPDGAWWEYLKGYTLFFPYLWPSKDRKLQLVMVFCIVLVLSQRAINVLVPNQLGTVTDILSGENGESRMHCHIS